MPKKLHESGPVHPKQSISNATKNTSSSDLSDLASGYSGSRARVQSRLGDNNARNLVDKALGNKYYPKASGKKAPK